MDVLRLDDYVSRAGIPKMHPTKCVGLPSSTGRLTRGFVATIPFSLGNDNHPYFNSTAFRNLCRLIPLAQYFPLLTFNAHKVTKVL